MAAATTPTCSLRELTWLRVMRVEAVAVIVTMEVSGSNPAIARDSVTFVALNVAESDLCQDQI